MRLDKDAERVHHKGAERPGGEAELCFRFAVSGAVQGLRSNRKRRLEVPLFIIGIHVHLPDEAVPSLWHCRKINRLSVRKSGGVPRKAEPLPFGILLSAIQTRIIKPRCSALLITTNKYLKRAEPFDIITARVLPESGRLTGALSWEDHI